MKQLKFSTWLDGNNINSKFKRGLSPLFVMVTLIILMILLPSMLTAAKLFEPVSESWEHIKTYLLKEYIMNSVVLIVFVGLFTGIIGTYFAWHLARYRWRFHGLLEILLFLPMAFPPYIAGYVYGGIFKPFGSLDQLLRMVNIKPPRIDILSMGGAIFVFSLCLMPYVMLITRGFFERLPKNIEESSRLLGKSRLETFYKVILPMSRGAIIGGVVLVMLEVLNDYGLVKYFGIPTFSTAIYKTWFGLSDVDGAIRLAASLMTIVVAVLLIEQFFRGKGRLSQARAVSDPGVKKVPSAPTKVIFYVISTLYLVIALYVPMAQLIYWAYISFGNVVFRGLWQVIGNTLFVSGIVTVLVVVSGILIGNLNRLHNGIMSKIYSRIVILGYSVPASIIAISILIFFISIDRSMGWLYGSLGLKKLFLTSSVTMLIFALTIRFMAIGFNSIESGMSKIGKKYYEASKLLGKNGFQTFWLVDFPMMKTAIISAAILTFVDILKELPLTLILRPFNFDTLATKVFTYAGDEMIQEASVYALMIIIVSIIALIILSRLKRKRIA